MRSMRKYLLYLSILILLCTCEEIEDRAHPPKSMCDKLKDRVEECIGGKPVFIRSTCIEEEIEPLLDLSCPDLLNYLLGG